MVNGNLIASKKLKVSIFAFLLHMWYVEYLFHNQCHNICVYTIENNIVRIYGVVILNLKNQKASTN